MDSGPGSSTNIDIAVRSSTGASCPCACGAAAGFSLIEMMIGIAVFTVGFMGIGALYIMNDRSSVLAVEETVATNALRGVAERIRSAPFEDVATAYQGFGFSVAEIGGTGTVEIFVDETAGSPEAAELGLPRDLDGDGSAATVNVASSYQLLPVRIDVSWTANDGPQTRSLSLLLATQE